MINALKKRGVYFCFNSPATITMVSHTCRLCSIPVNTRPYRFIEKQISIVTANLFRQSSKGSCSRIIRPVAMASTRLISSGIYTNRFDSGAKMANRKGQRILLEGEENSSGFTP
jgi:hypothetical protein